MKGAPADRVRRVIARDLLIDPVVLIAFLFLGYYLVEALRF